MPDAHDAAVEAMAAGMGIILSDHWRERFGQGFAALTEAGYAVVKLPEGVTVAHGARLVRSPIVNWGTWDHVEGLYAIEATP